MKCAFLSTCRISPIGRSLLSELHRRASLKHSPRGRLWKCHHASGALDLGEPQQSQCLCQRWRRCVPNLQRGNSVSAVLVPRSTPGLCGLDGLGGRERDHHGCETKQHSRRLLFLLLRLQPGQLGARGAGARVRRPRGRLGAHHGAFRRFRAAGGVVQPALRR